MRDYGNCGTGYVYNHSQPDLPRGAGDAPPRSRELRPSPIVLHDPTPRMSRPSTIARAKQPKQPKPRVYKGRGPVATPAEVVDEIVRRHRAGESVRAIRASLGIGYGRVAEALRDNGIEPSKARRRPDHPWPCTECSRPMRPWNADPEKWPKGSVVHAGRERCVNCKTREAKRLAREAAA